MFHDRFKKDIILFYGILLLLLFNFESRAYAQSSAQIKGAFIYNFIKSSQWPEFDGPFKVALLGKDNNLFRELSSSLPGRQVIDRSIQVVRTGDVQEVKSAQVLVLGPSENSNISSITNDLGGSHTLIITDGSDDVSSIMLNIVTSVVGRISFEVNLANIIAEDIGVSDDILTIGGADLEVVEVYRELGTALELQRQAMASQNAELKRIQAEVSQQESMIETQNQQLAQQTEQLQQQTSQLEDQLERIEQQRADIIERENTLAGIEAQLGVQRANLENNQAEALNTERMLRAKLDTLSIREAEVEALAEQIGSNNAELERQQQEIANLAAETERQRQSLQTQDTTIQKQQTALIMGAAFVIILIILSGVIARSYQVNRRQSAALKENEKRFRMLFDSANDGILIIKDEKIADCNLKALEMFDCTKDQIIGSSPYNYSPPDQPDGGDSEKKATEYMMEALSGNPIFFEWVHKKQSGSLFEAEVGLNAIEVSGELFLQAFIRDITDRKKAEEELKNAKNELVIANENLEQKVEERTREINDQLNEIRNAEEALKEGEARYKALITTSNTGAWEFHGDTGFLWCSKEYFSMLGRNIEDYDLSGAPNLEETWVELLHPDDRERSSKHFADYLEGGSVGMYETYFRMKHTDGHWVWIWSRGSTLRDNDGNLTSKTVGTHIDITEQKKTEQELKEYQEHLEKQSHDLSERVKELNCLFGVAKLVEKENNTPDDIFQGTADLLPPGWQYPEITCGKVIFKDKVFQTENFEDSAWQQSSDIRVFDKKSGEIIVGYLEEKPDYDEGPFLQEERNLLDALAERLGQATEKLESEKKLKEYQENLEELIEERTRELARINMLSDNALELTKTGFWDIDYSDPDYYTSSERAARIFGEEPK
ncbi:YfiR/HmsC family protein, partial [candidate division KSB1 bacterium]